MTVTPAVPVTAFVNLRVCCQHAGGSQGPLFPQTASLQVAEAAFHLLFVRLGWASSALRCKGQGA